MKLFVVASLLLIATLASASVTCETPSGATVTLEGALSENEFKLAMNNWGEIKAAMLGGMKLHRYMREHELDWLILTVRPGEHTYWNHSTRLVLTLPDGACLESVDMACTDSPLEREFYLLVDGLWLAGPHLARVKSGGVLVMAGFPAGSVIVEHGPYWAETVEPVTMEVLE